MEKELLLDMLAQNKATCSFAFNAITPDNARLRLNEQTASVGFIYRHIGETMNLFGTFFGIPTDVRNTTMGAADTGQGQSVEESRQLLEHGYAIFENLIQTTLASDWLQPVETPFFGPVSRVKLFHTFSFTTPIMPGR